jgi:hypothetical protein
VDAKYFHSLPVVLHEIDRDRRIRPACGGALAALEGHFDSVRFRDVEDPVGERFDLVS